MPTTYSSVQDTEIVKEEDLEAINKAKDLLWEFINEDNKKMLIHAANTDVLKRNDLQLKAINVSYQYI